MSKIVEIKDVTISYRENIALRNITLSIEEGTLLAIIGPNGAGKTTLLTAINGLGNILSGSVRVFGENITPGLRKGIGYVPQSVAIDPRAPISVRDVVMIGRLSKVGLFHRANHRDEELVESAMELVGIKELARRPIGHLSYGEQQKVAIARALAQQPRIMLLDEPTSNLDLKAQREIIDLIDSIYMKKQLTIVVVTHILNHIPPSCKRVLMMKKGRIIWFGAMEEALNNDLLSGLYGCPIETVRR